MRHRNLLTAACLIAVLAPWARPAFAGGGFYGQEGGRLGWYNYEVLPDPEQEEPDDQKEPEESPASPTWPSFQEAIAMRSPELRALIQRATEEAVSDPNEENVLRYVTYTNAAREKAYQFSQATAWVQEQHPELKFFGAGDHPASSRPLARYFETAQNEYLTENRNQFALIAFIDPENPITENLIQGVESVADEIGWPLQVFNGREKPEHAAAFGVTMLPQIFVLPRDKSIKPFIAATGMVAQSTLKTKLYRGLRLVTGETDLRTFIDQPGEANPLAFGETEARLFP